MRLLSLVVVVVAAAASAAAAAGDGDAPEGHLKPLGTFGLNVGPPAEVTYGEGETAAPEPTAREFYMHFVAQGKPLLMRQLARRWPAYTRWASDDYLSSKIANVTVQCEKTKKEVRGEDQVGMRYDDYRAAAARDADKWYVVDDLPAPLYADCALPAFMHCDSFNREIPSWWVSTGGTHSVLHFDSIHNLHCLVAGKKDFFLAAPEHRERFYVSAEDDGGTAPFDVTAVDLQRYPTVADTKYHAFTLDAGDCLYIPATWLHQVNSRERNIAVTSWFGSTGETDSAKPQRAISYDAATCSHQHRAQQPDATAADKMVPFTEVPWFEVANQVDDAADEVINLLFEKQAAACREMTTGDGKDAQEFCWKLALGQHVLGPGDVEQMAELQALLLDTYKAHHPTPIRKRIMELMDVDHNEMITWTELQRYAAHLKWQEEAEEHMRAEFQKFKAKMAAEGKIVDGDGTPEVTEVITDGPDVEFKVPKHFSAEQTARAKAVLEARLGHSFGGRVVHVEVPDELKNDEERAAAAASGRAAAGRGGRQQRPYSPSSSAAGGAGGAGGKRRSRVKTEVVGLTGDDLARLERQGRLAQDQAMQDGVRAASRTPGSDPIVGDDDDGPAAAAAAGGGGGGGGGGDAADSPLPVDDGGVHMREFKHLRGASRSELDKMAQRIAEVREQGGSAGAAAEAAAAEARRSAGPYSPRTAGGKQRKQQAGDGAAAGAAKSEL